MTSISQITNYEENCYQVIDDYLGNAYIELTFLGKRRIKAIGYKDSIDLYDMAWKIVDIFNSHKDVTKNEYDLGVEIERKLLHLREIQFDQEERTNLITKLFIFVRDNIYGILHSYDPNPFCGDLPEFESLVMFSHYRS